MAGKPFCFGDGDPRQLESAEAWSEERIIRGQVLAELLMRAEASGLPEIGQVQITGARVTSRVDISHTNMAIGVHFIRCLFDDELNLFNVRMRSLLLESSVVLSINATGASFDGFLGIVGSQIQRSLFLGHARIDRSLALSGSRVLGNSGIAVIADQMRVGGDVSLDEALHCTGIVRMLGVRIGGSLKCAGGVFENPDGVALAADAAVVGAGAFLGKVTDSTDRFLAAGTVRLVGARIGGQLNCTGGRFFTPGGEALSLDGAEVGVGVFLNRPLDGGESFHAVGAVRLLSACVNGQLACSGGRFENPDSDALAADGLEVRGGAHLDAGFHAVGAVSLLGARISGDLSCSRGRFDNPGGTALGADNAEIGQSMLLNKLPSETEGFHATGVVQLLGSRIGGQLNCSGGTFENPGGVALGLQEARAGSLWICDTSFGVPGLVDLVGAKTSFLVDDLAILAGPDPLIRLDGFEYERISPSSPQDVSARLKWIDRQPLYNPQPYDQLAAVFRRSGQDHEVRDVLVAKRRKRRWHLKSQEHHGLLGTLKAWVNWLWDAFLDWSVLYGWHPWRPLVLGSAFFLISVVLVSIAEATGYVRNLTEAALPYTSFIHTLDIFLPIVDLGVESNWMIDASNSDAFAWLITWLLWALKLVGWGTVTLALAALTGIVKRD